MSKHRNPTTRSGTLTSVTRDHMNGKPLRDCSPSLVRVSGPGNSKRYRKQAAS